MRELVILTVPALVLALLYCLWRAQHLLRTWRPAAATVWKSDYSDTERADHGNFQALLGVPGLRLDPVGRTTLDDVVFTDGEGVRRRVAVQHRVPRGTERQGVCTIWYDPADPQARVTACGPGRWLARALKCGAALAGLLYFGPGLLASWP